MVQGDLKAKYNREKAENLLKRSFFYAPSFDIYGGCAGFYDFGPLGSALKSNIEGTWRNHFILEEDMLELTCSNITLEQVL
jgi:glycyl-tRNA synthetase